VDENLYFFKKYTFLSGSVQHTVNLLLNLSATIFTIAKVTIFLDSLLFVLLICALNFYLIFAFMDTTSTQPHQSPLGSQNNSEPSQNSSMKPSPGAQFSQKSSPGQKPSPVQKPSPGQKPVKAKKPTYSGSSKNSSTVRSRVNSTQQQNHNTSFLSESSESNRRHYSFNVQRSYLGSLKNDPSIDGLMEFCQATIDGLV